MAEITLYGIANCDTVRKAKKWLESQSLEYDFIDFRKDGISTEQAARWVDQAGLDKVLNKRGTTWRRLSEQQQLSISDSDVAIALLVAQPTLMKRPIVEYQNHLTVGFDITTYQDTF